MVRLVRTMVRRKMAILMMTAMRLNDDHLRGKKIFMRVLENNLKLLSK